MQRIKLDINPKGEIPVLNVAQYDNGRTFAIELVEGENAYNVPSGYSVQLNVRKTDSKLVTKAPDSIVDNILTFSTTEQMTACSGENIASVTLKDADDIVITTLYFLISVQRDVLAGGLSSQSEIHDLEEQIAAIVPEVIGEDYYNKTETNALLADKADKSELPDMTNYYTKTETDDLLYDKVDYDELNQYYKKTEVDNLLNAKVDKTTLQEDYYDADYITTIFARKTFVENYVDATATASGNPCIFETAKYHTLIQTLTANIVCGGGGGTPSTPIPLVGHSELNLTKSGVNLWDGVTESGYIYNGNEYPSTSYWRTKNYIPIAPNTDYYFRASANDGQINWYDINKTFISAEGSMGGVDRVATSPANACFVRFYQPNSSDTSDTGVNYPSTDTTYHAYNGTPYLVQFGRVVYGGVYDKSGRLTITWTGTKIKDLGWYYDSGFQRFYSTVQVDIKHPASDNDTPFILCDIYTPVAFSYFNSAERPNNSISNPIANGRINIRDTRFTDTTSFIASVGEYYLAYELATPIVIDVPSISVFAENGVNNITSDCIGDVNVSYKDTIQHYIDQRLQ